MTTSAVESIPAIWDDARDIPFFRITARLFTPEFCFGASVLLASNDDKVNAVQPTPAEYRTSTTTPAGFNTDARPERDLIPVRVRRIR